MSTPLEDLQKVYKDNEKKVKKLLKDPKKLIIAIMPYLIFAYFFNKIGYA